MDAYKEEGATYLVERYWPGLTREKLDEAALRLREAAVGEPVVYLGSIFVPGDEMSFCLFRGPSEAAVARVNERAGVAFERVVESIEINRTRLEEEEKLS
jgi:hypothetical protein